jgi:ribosome maturation factor RimP
MKHRIAVVTLTLTVTLIAFAHGKEKHVMGTVTNISETSITVETSAKQSVTIEVNDKTKFEKSGSAATLKDLKVGTG